MDKGSITSPSQPPLLAKKSKPMEPPSSLTLGRTSGVVAAGAWAARWEVASLLESRCDPGALVEVIRSGSEGDHILNTVPSATSASVRSWSPVTSGMPSSFKGEGNDLEDPPSDGDVWEKDIMRQAAILDSIQAQPKGGLPPWVIGDASSRAAAGYSSSSTPAVAPIAAPYVGNSNVVKFEKMASPPPKGVPLKRNLGAPREEARVDSDRLQSEAKEEEVEFSKPAKPPPEYPSEGNPGEKEPKGERSRDRRSAPVSMEEREKQGLIKYDTDCETIFGILKGRFQVQMDLIEIVEENGKFDRERFRKLTAPNKSSTGLNYTRLMSRFLKWRLDRPDLDGRSGGFDAKMGVLDFVEHLMQQQVGYLTPRSFLYSVDYFARAFGFSPSGGHWARAKRLAATFATSKKEPVSRAPGFCRATMCALERAVLDSSLPITERVACGKLRLCIQASVRYDDLLNTPLECCEWVRRPGEVNIIGLRSRALRGKSGPRAWIAALSGVHPDHDDWLPTLMKLLLEAHGATWKWDDHTGKLASPISNNS